MIRQTRQKGVVCIGSLAMSFAFSISAAFAFTQEPVKSPPPAATTQPQAQIVQPQAPDAASKAPLVATGPQGVYIQPFALNDGKSTEVNIPGIGSVGSLPKLDFGLELLYSPNNNVNGQAPQIDPRAPDSDVQIKGSLKHKF